MATTTRRNDDQLEERLLAEFGGDVQRAAEALFDLLADERVGDLDMRMVYDRMVETKSSAMSTETRR